MRPHSLLGVLGYDYHNKAGPGGETTHLGLFSMLRHPSPHPNSNVKVGPGGEKTYLGMFSLLRHPGPYLTLTLTLTLILALALTLTLTLSGG